MPTVAEALAARLRFSVVDDPRGARQVVGLHADDLFPLHRGLRELAGDYGPRSVDLPGSPVADPHGLAEAFGAKVRFRRSAALLRLPAGVLSRPAGAPERSGFAWRVRDLLSDGMLSLAEVARALAVHPRTLQRTLADEGLAFGEIRDCVRREQARAYLTRTDLSLADISARLGFAEPAVFTRCARRWWGLSPVRMRLR